MSYTKLSQKRGNTRLMIPVLCNTCGTAYAVAYDPEADEYICRECIAKEQDALDEIEEAAEDLTETIRDLMEMEHTYRLKGDN